MTTLNLGKFHVSLHTVALLFAGLSVTLRAQQTTATLVGTVTDASGASVPQALIRVNSLSTNATREATTDASGAYSITFLQAGDYNITASLKASALTRNDPPLLI